MKTIHLLQKDNFKAPFNLLDAAVVPPMPNICLSHSFFNLSNNAAVVWFFVFKEDDAASDAADAALAAASAALAAASSEGGAPSTDDTTKKAASKASAAKASAKEAAAEAAAAGWRVEPNSWVDNAYRWKGFNKDEMANASPQLCRETCDAEKEDYGCAGFGYDKDGQRGCYLFEPGSTYISDKPEDIAGSYDAYLRGSAV